MKRNASRILTINAGSSSIKYGLFDAGAGLCVSSGIVERVGVRGGVSYVDAMGMIAAEYSAGRGLDAIGHRFAHGGSVFPGPVLLTDENIKACRRLEPLAPLHMHNSLACVDECRVRFLDVPNYAVFDTTFHCSMPAYAQTYAISPKWTEKGVRKYGFHGISHQYVTQEAAKMLRKASSSLRLVTCHLGSGCSVAAVCRGQSIDTSMGFTPLSGLMMGTRSGDIDPAAVLNIMESEKLSPSKMLKVLNEKSGFQAVSGIVGGDCRDVLLHAAKGGRRARLAIDMFCYRAALYIGQYNVAVGGMDALVFTGGIGVNSPVIRKRIVEWLKALGVELNDDLNTSTRNIGGCVSSRKSKVKVLVVPTHEELLIAKTVSAILNRRHLVGEAKLGYVTKTKRGF